MIVTGASFGFTIKLGNVIETHEHAGDFKERERGKKSRHTVKYDGSL